MHGLLTVILLTIHLLTANLASGAPLYCIWLARGQHTVRNQVGRSMAWMSVWAFVVSMLSGGVLYFLSEPTFKEAVQRLPTRSLWFAAGELAFSLVCLVIYAGSWHKLRNLRWLHALVAVLTSTNLLYHFPPLMSVLGKLGSDPNWMKAVVLDRATLLPLFTRPEILALTLHFVFASFAVSALAVCRYLVRAEDESCGDAVRPTLRRAGWLTLMFSVLQIPIGVWLLLALPDAGRMAMMGSNMLASLAFLGSLLLTFLLLQRLLAIAIGTVSSQEVRTTCWLLAFLILLMTSALYQTRSQHRHSTANKKAAVVQLTPRLQ